MLYASKLDLLMAVNAGENITWQGPTGSGRCRTSPASPAPRSR